MNNTMNIYRRTT